MDLISVIMPAYNEEKYIGEAVRSVINQTYLNWELIIVNDGSIDGTKEIILDFQSKYPDKIHVVNKIKNEGTVAAINTAMLSARGKYMCWLSADDLYKNEMLKSSIDFLLNNKEYQAVFSKYELIDENSKYKGFINLVDYFIELDNGKSTQPYERLIKMGSAFHGCAVFAERDSFIKAGKFNSKYKYAHDYDFWLRFVVHTNIGYLNRINVQGREHDEQVTKLGNNEVDAIHVFFDFIHDNKEGFRKLLEKAGIEDESVGLLKCIEERILTFSSCKKEFSALCDCIFSLLNEQGMENYQFKEFLELQLTLIRSDFRIPCDTFFSEQTKGNYFDLLCEQEGMDGIIINKQGIRFDRYRDLNDMVRVVRGLECINELLFFYAGEQEIDCIIESHKDMLKYAINKKEEKKLYKIGFTSYMQYDSAYAKILGGKEIYDTGSTIWHSMFEVIINNFVVRPE